MDSILGRVIYIDADRSLVDASDIPVHPDSALAINRTGPLIKLQLIMDQMMSEDLHPDATWPFLNEATLMATRGLLQVAHTNCVVWISPEQVIHLIAVFHTDDAINHTYGDISGRENAFFTCSNAMFDNGNGDSHSHALHFVLHCQYLAFGPSTNSHNPVMVTETEREVETKYSMHRIFQKLLTKVGKIGGTGLYTCPFSRADWYYLASNLAALDPSLLPLPSDMQSIDTSQAILHGNLSLETKVVPTTLIAINIKTP
mmetsp:Transcript_7240/g.16436  ORF Transcript_7240/g.16436 Transcript_7240/m.16436 type:complete len:258 (-) Transcript_7240:619-1392(-)